MKAAKSEGLQDLLRKSFWMALRIAGFKKLSWDRQFAAGRWCQGGRRPRTVELVKRLCNGRDMIEFGCGNGNLVPYLVPLNAFSSYQGYDVSSVAIEQARKMAQQMGLSNCRFDQGDMANWPGARDVSFILAEECLNYLTNKELTTFLIRCMESLKPDGLMHITLHSAKKHARVVELCHEICPILEEVKEGEAIFITLGRRMH